MKLLPSGVGEVLGCESVDDFTVVYYGRICSHRFNLWEVSFGDKPDYTMYLDGNIDEPYFLAEREGVAKKKIMELLNGY
jgi:hypothetical protein